MLRSAFAAHVSKVLHVLDLHTKGSHNTSSLYDCPLCVGLLGAVFLLAADRSTMLHVLCLHTKGSHNSDHGALGP